MRSAALTGLDADGSGKYGQNTAERIMVPTQRQIPPRRFPREAVISGLSRQIPFPFYTFKTNDS